MSAVIFAPPRASLTFESEARLESEEEEEEEEEEEVLPRFAADQFGERAAAAAAADDRWPRCSGIATERPIFRRLPADLRALMKLGRGRLCVRPASERAREANRKNKSRPRAGAKERRAHVAQPPPQRARIQC